jgi:uncharacterized protein YcgI (DUF1989 family)
VHAAVGTGVTVEQGAAASGVLHAGDVLRIEQVGGGQCVDVVLWGGDEPAERFSATLTRVREGARPTRGSVLWSGWPHERQLARIIADSASGHDLLHPACTPGEYERVGAPGSPACVLVQEEAAAAWGIHRTALPDPLNLWFRPTLSDDGRVGWQRTPTRPGDHVELRALVDLLVIVNPCVDDVFGCSSDPRGAILVGRTPDDPGAPLRVTGAPVPVHELVVPLGPPATSALAGLGDEERARAVRTGALRHALGSLEGSSP